MPNSYFSIPIYIDKTADIEQILPAEKSSIFIFVKKEDYTPENSSLLRKILHAIQLDMDRDVHLFLLKADQNAYVFDRLDIEGDVTFLAFGLNAKRLGLQTKTIPYKWMTLDTLQILFSHTLSDLQKNVNYKKQLWGLLQQFRK